MLRAYDLALISHAGHLFIALQFLAHRKALFSPKLGAHHLKRATALFSCPGVFTDRPIFTLNLITSHSDQRRNLSDQSQARHHVR